MSSGLPTALIVQCRVFLIEMSFTMRWMHAQIPEFVLGDRDRELTVCCRLIRFSWHGASLPGEKVQNKEVLMSISRPCGM